MKCPICGDGELELSHGEQRLGGLFVGPDVLICLVCESQAERRGDQLRYTFIPSPYSAAIGKQLADFTEMQQVSVIGAEAQRFLRQREAIVSGMPEPCIPPFPLKRNEECVHVSLKPGVLLEERTRQGQPYWAKLEKGEVVITTRAVYVGHRDTPLSKLDSASLSGPYLDLTRIDRKRPQRIAFPSANLAHLAAVTLAYLVPDILEPPQLSQMPFQQGPTPLRLNLRVPLSIPVGGGQRIRLPLYLLLVLVPTLLCSLCVAGNAAVATADRTLRGVGFLPTLTPTVTYTPTSTVTRTPTITDTPVPTNTPNPTSTSVPTDTRVPTDVPTPTETPLPLLATDRPTPSLSPQITTLTILADALNVRSGPGTAYDVAGQVNKGDTIEVLGCNASRDWFQIAAGWVSSGYVEVMGDVSLLPVVQAPPLPTATATAVALPTPVPTNTPVSVAPPPAPAQTCCRVCTGGKACGDTCISRDKQCHTPPGCACNAY